MQNERLFPVTVMPDSDWWHTLCPDPKAVLRSLDSKPDMQVVDLCCGSVFVKSTDSWHIEKHDRHNGEIDLT